MKTALYTFRMASDLRTKILELAITTIDDAGEQGIRTNKIAFDAGTTPPTLYHYFHSREGLIEAAQVERFVRSLNDDVDQLIDSLEKVSTFDQLQESLRELFARRDSPEREDARHRRLNALGASFARPSLALRIAEETNIIAARTAEALAPFQARGFIRPDIDLQAVSVWYIGASIGKILVTLKDSTIEIGQWERTMNEAVISVLFGSSLQ